MNKQLIQMWLNSSTPMCTPKSALFFVLLFTGIFASCSGQTKQENERILINQLVDEWHLAAAEADTLFFDFLAPDAVYIGTDASERWTKEEFKAFAMPYFLKGKAWDFKPIERAVYFGNQPDMAWFNETLDTWMGVCRSSGVLVLDRDKKWKIRHYHLSCTVPNEKVKEFIGLMNRKDSL